MSHPPPVPLRRVPLQWQPTQRLRRLALVAALAVVGAVITAHGALLVLAAAPLVVLALTGRAVLPASVEVAAGLDVDRCVEQDEVVLTLRLRGRGMERAGARVWLPPHTESRYAGGAPGHDAEDTDLDADGAVTSRWTLVPRRWGRYDVGPVRLRLSAGAGCYQAVVDVPVGELVVYPGEGALARAVAPRELAAPLGEHPSRAAGSGVEFAGVRPYQPGDRRRDVDWRTSARHQDLFVRQYAAERAFDLVLVLDTAGDAGRPGSSTLDLTVRAASGLAQSYLRAHDRVGLLTFGGPLHWLTPATGPRQRYQVHEALMSVRPDRADRDAGQVGYGLERLPSRMLPRRAFVALLTPLLDEGPLDAVRLLRERGFSPLVIDVLTTEPSARQGTPAHLALRTWRLQRDAWRVELAGMGVPLLSWDGEADLTGALLHAMRALRPEVRV